MRSKPLAVRRTWMLERESFGAHNISQKQSTTAKRFRKKEIKRRMEKSIQKLKLKAVCKKHGLHVQHGGNDRRTESNTLKKQ